jgi:hypothetical protein
MTRYYAYVPHADKAGIESVSLYPRDVHPHNVVRVIATSRKAWDIVCSGPEMGITSFVTHSYLSPCYCLVTKPSLNTSHF